MTSSRGRRCPWPRHTSCGRRRRPPAWLRAVGVLPQPAGDLTAPSLTLTSRVGLGQTGIVLTATFVRRTGLRDHVYVLRADDSTVDWEFPSYGDGLPHDLCHLVVEQALGLPDGFWGLIDRHVDVSLVDNQATLIRGGRPLVKEPGVDLAGLRWAENAVDVLASPHPDADATLSIAAHRTVTAITDRLRHLGHHWRTLHDGGAITLVFAVADTRP